MCHRVAHEKSGSEVGDQRRPCRSVCPRLQGSFRPTGRIRRHRCRLAGSRRQRGVLRRLLTGRFPGAARHADVQWCRSPVTTITASSFVGCLTFHTGTANRQRVIASVQSESTLSAYHAHADLTSRQLSRQATVNRSTLPTAVQRGPPRQKWHSPACSRAPQAVTAPSTDHHARVEHHHSHAG